MPASILLSVALKSVVLLGVTWLVALAMRARSAAALHLVWTAGMVALLALPLLTLAIPALRVGVPVPTGLVFQTTAVDRPPAASPQSAARPAVAVAPIHRAPWRPDWRLWLTLLWAAGAAASFAQMLAGWVSMARLRRRARPFPGSGACDVDVLEATAGSMPVSFGLLRPAIFMPADAANWTAERRRVVLLHELAHVRRGDHATHLLARAALSLYWWNPLAWMAWRETLKSREQAADVMVLASGAAAPDYAAHLLEIAGAMHAASALGWAAVAMARPSQLEGRLLAILDPRRVRNSHTRAAAWVAAIAAAAIVIPLAALQAQDAAPQPPGTVDAAIAAATVQKNHDMLEAAARDAEAVRNYDTARKLLDSSLAIREQTAGPSSVSYGLGLLKIGDLEANRDKPAEAESFYQKALTVLQGTPEAATALIDLGTVALVRSDPEAAFSYFERARSADPAKAATALGWQAIARDRQARFDEADTLYRAAIDAQDPHSPEAATIMDLYARFLTRRNRPADADSLRFQALARKALALQPPARPTDAVRIGGGVTPPMLQHKVEPQYSEEARLAKLDGTVVLYVEVGPDGMAHNVHVMRSLGLGLDQKAIDAVSQWQFQPGTKNGVPVTVQSTVEVNFRLL
jgi:TonB family protein